MIFYTVSGSTYELDTTNKKIRRLHGQRPTTERQEKDGEWKQYADIMPNDIVSGKAVLIVWQYDLIDGRAIARSTLTSLVKEIVKEEKNVMIV